MLEVGPVVLFEQSQRRFQKWNVQYWIFLKLSGIWWEKETWSLWLGTCLITSLLLMFCFSRIITWVTFFSMIIYWLILLSMLSFYGYERKLGLFDCLPPQLLMEWKWKLDICSTKAMEGNWDCPFEDLHGSYHFLEGLNHQVGVSVYHEYIHSCNNILIRNFSQSNNSHVIEWIMIILVKTQPNILINFINSCSGYFMDGEMRNA